MKTTRRGARLHAEHGAVAVLTDNGCVRLVLSGAIDPLCADELNDAVPGTITGLPVEIDTRDVTFMDSTGVSALEALTRASPLRATFVEPTDLVRFLLQMTHLGTSVESTRGA